MRRGYIVSDLDKIRKLSPPALDRAVLAIEIVHRGAWSAADRYEHLMLCIQILAAEGIPPTVCGIRTKAETLLVKVFRQADLHRETKHLARQQPPPDLPLEKAQGLMSAAGFTSMYFRSKYHISSYSCQSLFDLLRVPAIQQELAGVH